MGNKPKKIPEKLLIEVDSDRLINVIRGFEIGDISECLIPDVNHATEVLAGVIYLEDLAPGFFGEMLSVLIPHFEKMHYKKSMGEFAQKKADEEGIGEEWRAAIKAGNSPNQKDFMAMMVNIVMKTADVNQNEAIKMAATQLGRDEDSIRRIVTRSKARIKKRK